MKIAIYSICKNEKKHIERFLQMASEADRLCVLDTGSTDGSEDLWRASHPNLYFEKMHIEPWRFDTARNICLQMVPSDYDLCLWMDLDEYYHPGWRQIVESQYEPDVDKYVNRFINMATRFEYFHSKIHKRLDCEWKFPIHEQLIFNRPEKLKVIDNLLCEHHQDLTKDRRFYISMITRALADNELPKWQYVPLLIREYFVNKQFEECRKAFENFLTDPASKRLPANKRANCWRYYITSLEELGLPRSKSLIEEYAAIYPTRDHYYVAAWALRKIGEFSRGLEFLALGDQMMAIDQGAEFIHPSARSEKYEKLRQNLILGV